MMSQRLSLSVKWGIVGIWLCLVCILIYRTYIKGVDFTPLQTLSEKQFKTNEEWLGIYVQNKKIGHVETIVEKIGSEYRFTQHGETEITQDGERMLSTTKFTCLTDLTYVIKSFDYEVRSSKTYFKSHGELDKDNMLLVFIESEDGKKTQTSKIQGNPYLYATVKQMLIAQGLKKGKRFNVPVLDIFSLQVKDNVVEVLDLIPVKAGINVYTAYVLKIGETLSWISDRGNTLKERHPSGFMYLADTQDSVKEKRAHYLFDYLSIPVLKANKLLPYPESLSRLKVRLSGLNMDAYPLLNGGRQVLSGNILEVKKEDMEELKKSTYALPYEKKDLDDFLEPTPFVQSDHHTVIYNAKKFIAIEKHAFKMARYLTSNLYLTIMKKPVSRLNTAMDIFNTHAGESNEHTVIFTSFARAGGMPTRMVGGLVYLKGHFYYHAWPEVWLGRWAAVDPTLGQFPADVTHIRLLEGDINEIASLGNIIGKIKIDIIEAL